MLFSFVVLLFCHSVVFSKLILSDNSSLVWQTMSVVSTKMIDLNVTTANQCSMQDWHLFSSDDRCSLSKLPEEEWSAIKACITHEDDFQCYDDPVPCLVGLQNVLNAISNFSLKYVILANDLPIFAQMEHKQPPSELVLDFVNDPFEVKNVSVMCLPFHAILRYFGLKVEIIKETDPEYNLFRLSNQSVIGRRKGQVWDDMVDTIHKSSVKYMTEKKEEVGWFRNFLQSLMFWK